MKTSRYTEAQIIAILRQAEGGVPVAELCREHGMSSASFYKWRAKQFGLNNLIRRFRWVFALVLSREGRSGLRR